MSRADDDRFDALVERLALPFVFATALGVGIGRQLGSGPVAAVAFGLVAGGVLFALFAWVRIRVADLPE